MPTNKMLKMRLALGYTQKQVAELLEVHPDTIRNYEKGRTPVPFDIYSDLYREYRDFKKAEKIHANKKAASRKEAA